MAPQNKRQNTAKAPVAAKKAKVDAPPEDPVTTQLTPILDALAASKLPAPCCHLLRVALPHCFRGSVEERHAYQLKVLELAADLIKADEADKQASLVAAEEKAEAGTTAVETSKSALEAAKKLASDKVDELEKKAKEVTEATTEMEAATQAVELEMKNKDAFLVEKAAIVAEPEAFQSVLTELWEPLKSSSFGAQQYRKRDKAILQLVEKLAPLEIEESLLDAVAAALKLRQDKREGFAETAFKFLLEAFEKHQSLLAERVAGTSTKEQEYEKAVKEAETKRSEKQEKLAAREKEHEQLQNEWADLETKSKEAETTVGDTESDLKEAQVELEYAKGAVGSALQVTEAFLKMKEQKEIVAAEEPISNEPVAPAMEVEVAPDVSTSLEIDETSTAAVVA